MFLRKSVYLFTTLSSLLLAKKMAHTKLSFYGLYILIFLIKVTIVDDRNVVASKNINIFPGIVSKKETPVSCVENVPVDLFS